MKKILIILSVCLLLITVWFGEGRSFYCLDDKHCVTVWKTYYNRCYVIPGKYYGLFKPSGSYIESTNLSSMDLIWNGTPHEIIVNKDNNTTIVNRFPKSNNLIDYNTNKIHNDSLFISFDGKYHRYRKGVMFISIFIEEDYAVGNNGKKL
jgi:hypothetical protein